MLEPARLAGYGRFLDEFADDPTAWRALPRDVAGWWRRRAASRVVSVHGRWTVEGPAALDGRIALHDPVRPSTRRSASSVAARVPLNSER
jgi:hypothetical protein